MTEPDPLGRIIISDHARTRVRERSIGMDDLAVRAEVRIAILAGRVMDTRPDWARGEEHEGEVWFAYDATASRCWVLVRAREDGRASVVKTLLVSDDERARVGRTRLYRH